MDSQRILKRALTSSHPPWFWGVTTLLSTSFIGYLDWVTGYEMDFFVFYFLPIAVAAWYLEFSGAVCLSVISALVWYVVDALTGHVYSSRFYDVWDTLVHLSAFMVIGWCVSEIAKLLRNERQLLDRQSAALYREQQLSNELRKSMSEIKFLEGFLSICSQCKKIRDENGEWQLLESYISSHTFTTFSHGFCEECAQKVLAEIKRG